MPHFLRQYGFLMTHIFVSLILFYSTGVHAQSVMSETMKRVIDVQEEVTKRSSGAEIIRNVIDDLAAVDDKTISNLKTAIIERRRCLSQDVMPVYGGVKCPTEPRTLGLLNMQLVRAMQMQKVGSIRLAREVLCQTAKSYRPGSVQPTLGLEQKILWGLLRSGFEEAATSRDDEDAISQKCKGAKNVEDEFSSAIGSLAERAWMYDTIVELQKSCSGGSVTDSSQATQLRRVLEQCNAVDREGAKTEAEAQRAIDDIKAQLRADEQIAAAQPPVIAYSNQPSSVWNGEYTCRQGITRLQLRTHNSTAASVPPLLIFSFGPHPNNPSIPSGEFSMTANYTYQAGGNFNARPLNWIRQPSGYFMVGLNGNFSADMLQISGAVAGTGCTTFTLQRVLP